MEIHTIQLCLHRCNCIGIHTIPLKSMEFNKIFKKTHTLITQNLHDIFEKYKKCPKIETKKGLEKNKALAVAKGIYVRDIKNAENATKCNRTLNKVKMG